MKRKTIAVCVAGYDWELETRIVTGIHDACMENDMNILVFAGLHRKPDFDSQDAISENVVNGELEIFELINLNKIDAVIMLGESMYDQRIIGKIAEKCKANNVPIVNVNDPENILQYNVRMNDSKSMEKIMEHLVGDHGVRTVNYIGGFPGNIQTEERLATYKKVLTKYNIPIEEKRIGYGHFWVQAGDVAKQFIKDGLPEAIACANDTMAFFVIDELREHKIKVPDDVIVTGFDGILDCELFVPSLTTVRRDYYRAGRVAMDIIMDHFAGKPVSKVIEVGSELVKNCSCGCKKIIPVNTDDSYYAAKYAIHNRFKEFNTHIQNLNANFAAVNELKDILEDVNKCAYFFGFKTMLVCKCEDIERRGLKVDFEENQDKFHGFSPKMDLVMSYNGKAPDGTVFDTSDMLPYDVLEGEKPCFWAFSSMYFKNNALGYIAYEPMSTHSDEGELFGTWVMIFSNNAGSFYMKNELEFVVDKLENLYVRDPLTGLFNRRGTNRSSQVIAEANRINGLVTVICADVDNLKTINDKYGHEGGDVVIKKTAEALRNNITNGICIRTGGDEFCAIFAHEDNKDIGNIIKNIDDELDNFNAFSGLPYEARCSCGYVSGRIQTKEQLDQMMLSADTEMYRVKNEKKKRNL